jgi:hypothetical protein
MHENPYIDTVKEDLFISEWYLLRFKMEFFFYLQIQEESWDDIEMIESISWQIFYYFQVISLFYLIFCIKAYWLDFSMVVIWDDMKAGKDLVEKLGWILWLSWHFVEL